MAEREPPSPLKTQPEAKRPKSQVLRSESESETKTKIRQFNLIPLDEFNPLMFPTNAEVLRRMFFLSDEKKSRSKKSIADQVFKEMEVIYKKALAIERSTKKDFICVKQIEKLHEQFSNTTINYNPTKTQQQPKVQLFLDNLHKMCDIAPKDAEDQISKDRLRSQRKKDQDISFLNDQRTDRKQSLAKEDTAYTKKIDAKMSRDNALVKRFASGLNVSSPEEEPRASAAVALESTLPRVRPRSTPSVVEDIDTEESDPEYDYHFTLKPEDDPNYVQSRFLRDRPKKKTVVSSDSLVLQTADRRQLSNRQLTSVVGATLVDRGEDLNDYVLSRSTIDRNRQKMRSEISTEIKNSFIPPKRANVHFDGKTLEDLSGEFGDRLAIMLSGDTPECKSGKLLSARLIEDSSGQKQAEEVLRALNEWKVEKNVVAMCFDTTASNTGWINGAATHIEKSLEEITKRPLLWLPCRYHIHELFLTAAWETLFGKDMAPYYQDFKQFQKLYPSLDKKKVEELKIKQWMKPQRNHVVELCQVLLEERQPRDDYKECLDLTLAVLGSAPIDFSFKACGAFHKARWMAKLIYACKMFLLRSTLSLPIEQWLQERKKEERKKNTKKDKSQKIKNAQDYLERLEQFVTFVCLQYVEHWFCATKASEAPLMDLTFYKKMLNYQKSNEVVANAVLLKMYGHTWYLNQCYAPFSLFSENVPDEEKAEIALKLSKVKAPKKYSCGFPTPVPLDKLSVEDGLALKLSDFVDTESLFIFDEFGFKKEWLDKPVETWQNYQSFKEMQNWVKTLKVTNDAAERGIKLVSDYCKILTKDPEDLQNLLQVVEQNRREYPDVNKKTLNEKSKTKE